MSEGIVTLAGELESKSLCRIVVRMAENVAGVIEVRDQLRYQLDDSRMGPEIPPGALQYSAHERAG